MSPQFADYDADGRLDLVAGIFDGSPHVSLGAAEGFGPPQQILDRKGARIKLNMFWNFDTKKWDKTKSHDVPGTAVPEGQCTSAVAFDWDADGDPDLLLGDYKTGRIYLRMNQGRKGAAEFDELNLPLLSDGKPVVVPGKVATLRLFDWDRDGGLDLVCGAVDGVGEVGPGVYWLRNVGKPGAPEFAAPVALIPGRKGPISEPSAPNHGLYPDLGDIDGDGDIDIIVGGQSSYVPASRALTEAETARVKELNAALEALSERREAVLTKIREASKDDDKAYGKLHNAQRPVFDEILKQERPLRKELEALVPSPKTVNGVWLFLNESR